MPNSLKSRECSNIHMKGFVSDEELVQYYRQSRICIVPLRYGAGIKGKVIEAMYNRISMVSTEIGLEGLTDIQTIITPADDPESFAHQIIEKYTNEELLKQDSINYLRYLKAHFSYTYAKKLFEKIFS